MGKIGLDRRTFLRGVLGGAAVSVALPHLESMLSAGGGARAAQAAPRRMGVWFWGNGIRREHWIPDQTGTGWVAKEELRPLVDLGLRPYFNVVSGLEIKTDRHPHHSGMAGIMTGSIYHKVGNTRDTIISTFARPSIDQIAAEHFKGQTQFRSLEVAICKFRGTDEGTTFQYLSHNGPNNVNPSEHSPARLFARLFGTLPTPQVNLARRSVLDVVSQQARALRAKVSSRDRIRLEQHLESVRSIEQRLQRPGALCQTPGQPTDIMDVEGREQIEEKNQVMSDLVAVALACDLSRAFSVMFSSAGSGVMIWQVGANNSLHQICHDEMNPQPTVHRAVVFIMKQLAYFLARLRDTPELGGNLLDSCSILCTTELSEGNTHSNDEFPILIAGRAGGRLKGGLHFRAQNRDNASKAPLTVLRAAGVPLAEFGVAEGRVTESLSALEA